MVSWLPVPLSLDIKIPYLANPSTCYIQNEIVKTTTSHQLTSFNRIAPSSRNDTVSRLQTSSNKPQYQTLTTTTFHKSLHTRRSSQSQPPTQSTTHERPCSQLEQETPPQFPSPFPNTAAPVHATPSNPSTTHSQLESRPNSKATSSS